LGRSASGTGRWRPRLVGFDHASVDPDPEAPVVATLELLDLAVELDRQLEGLGIALEVGDYLVPGRVALRVVREGKSRQSAVAARREERQRLPTLAPRGSDLGGAFEDDEATPLAPEEVPDGQARLARADDGDFNHLA
jgi:hypothetical protein